MKGQFLNLLVVGMTLGTAWAIRGQFGHEQGAAWAGAIGAICILLVAKREDWYDKLFKATLAAAIGWGIGGIMSYGRVVGYGRGIDFGNVYYGLLMLFVIGGLYGFLGGGLFGLTLTDSSKSKVSWSNLLIGMTVGGIICYFFLIIEWEWLMTPPRSEVWAVCLGMAFYLVWYLIQHKHQNALRVAVFSGLGGGFGFAFGNFLMVLGSTSGIAFNFWNVMEYSLGFFGGMGMAYGTFTAQWEESDTIQQKNSYLIPLILVVFFIPFVVWDQSFELERLQKNYTDLVEGNPDFAASLVQLLVLVIIIFQFGIVLVKYFILKPVNTNFSRMEVKGFFMSHFAIYLILSLLITGALISTYRIEQYLYLVNYLIIMIILPKLSPVFSPRVIKPSKWLINFLGLLIFFSILALIAINIHGEMPGMQQRFDF
ncbi:hypothetical protein [Flexithrix dorotheae]|uniref:hypothetical protein n=1 Tax=Flexithrix dorotheae TaxID=70993 RepID=UPI00036395DF|nr:hypothetical protein [Flexithrix dorotheae]